MLGNNFLKLFILQIYFNTNFNLNLKFSVFITSSIVSLKYG